MLQLAIIADDLTGALDAAAPFAGVAGGVIVATRPEMLNAALAARPGVVSVSTRSREVHAGEAQRRVAAVLAELPRGVRLFKKIDSRLKGNVVSELEAFGDRKMIVAPAIPEFGRIVRNGHLEGFGIDTPMSVSEALGAASERAAVPDTVTASDMRQVLRLAGEGTVLVGARGLASALASSLGMVAAREPIHLAGPICIAIGSTDPITLSQVAHLVRDGEGVQHVRAVSGMVPPVPEGAYAPVTLLQIVGGREDDPSETSRRFAEGAAAWLAGARSVIFSGGATAEACLDAIGIDVLSLKGEALPGLPVSEGGGRTIVTKSGGFGDVDCLLRLVAGVVVTEA